MQGVTSQYSSIKHVRPKLVEGQAFARGFDKLSPNGVLIYAGASTGARGHILYYDIPQSEIKNDSIYITIQVAFF